METNQFTIIILFLIAGAAIGFLTTLMIYQRKINALNKKINESQSQLIKKDDSKTSAIDLAGKIWREEEVDFIFKLAEDLSLVIKQDEVAKKIVESVHKFLYVQKTILLLLNKETDEFRISYAIGLDKEMIDNFTLKKNDSITGVVTQGKQPLIVQDLDNEYYYQKLNKEYYFKKSFVSVPLIFQNEISGVLHVCDKQTDKSFTDRDVAFLVNVSRVAAIALQNVSLHEEIQNDYVKTITTLASAIDARDHYTKWHSENVARYSLAIAKEMNYSVLQTETLRHAALLHDIGKIGIKDNILLKADKLTEEEFQQFKFHPEIGEKIVKSLTFFKEVSVLIRHHHERCDGLGYPDRIKSDKIELGAKILAVADSFDAMTSDRLYRKALPLSDAIKELRINKGKQFDPYVVESFLKTLEQDPHLIQSLAT